MSMSNDSRSNSIEQAADVVAAYVANNSEPMADLPALIMSVQSVFARLAAGAAGVAPAAAN